MSAALDEDGFVAAGEHHGALAEHLGYLRPAPQLTADIGGNHCDAGVDRLHAGQALPHLRPNAVRADDETGFHRFAARDLQPPAAVRRLLHTLHLVVPRYHSGRKRFEKHRAQVAAVDLRARIFVRFLASTG